MFTPPAIPPSDFENFWEEPFDEETREFLREFVALDGVRVSILFYTSVAVFPPLGAAAFFGQMLGVSSGYSLYLMYREWDNLMEEIRPNLQSTQQTAELEENEPE